MSATSVPGQPLQPERQGMSTAARLFLALLGFLLLFGLCVILLTITIAGSVAFNIARNVESGPVDVAEAAREIATFDLPEGYQGSFTANALGFTMVGYDGAGGDSHIMLAQVPGWVRVDHHELERQAREAARRGQHGWEGHHFEVVGEETVTIRGDEVTITIGEGTNHHGEAYREIVVPFEGKGGQAVLIIVEPLATWDQAKIDAFIASFR